MSQSQLSSLEALVPLLRDVLLSNPQLGPEARDQWLALEPALQRSLAPQAPIPTDSTAPAPAPVSPLTLPLPDPTPDEYDLNRDRDLDLEAGLGSKESSEHSFQSQHDSHAEITEARWTSITLPVPTVQYLARLASLGWASLSETSRLATLQLFARPEGDSASDSGSGRGAVEELHLEQVSAFFTRIADRRQRRLERRRRVRAVCRSVGEWTAALALLLLLFFFAFISIWLAAAARGDVEKAFAGVMSSFWLLVLLYAAGRIALKGPMRFARRARLDEEQGVSYNADGVTRAQEGLVSGRRSGRIQLGASPPSRPVSV